MTWVQAQAPGLFPVGDRTKGIGALGLGPLERRVLRPVQVQTLKNLCDRLERFHQRRDRRHPGRAAPLRAHGRPWRDRALVFVLLSTGLRREELVRLNLDLFTADHYGQVVRPGQIQPYLQNRPAWVITFYGPGAVLDLPGPRGGSRPAAHHEVSVVIDAATGQYLMGFS